MSDYSELSSITDSSEKLSDSSIIKIRNDYDSIYNRLLVRYENLDKLDNNINDKIKEFNEYIKNINRTKKEIIKELKKDLLLLNKLYKKNSLKNTKRKKRENIKGFNIVETIPKEIKDYCGDIIPKEIIQASRPYVISSLHKAFKRDGLKIGRDTILDKKTSKILKREEGYIIKFQDYQKFLASYYKVTNI